MFANDVYLSSTVSILFHLTLTQAIRVLSNSTTNTTMTAPVEQSKNVIHDAFAQMDRGTLIRAAIVIAGITGLILLYVGVKTLLLRKKRQPKRYTLITDPTTIEEPLFNEPLDDDDEEDETEDNTLFVRK